MVSNKAAHFSSFFKYMDAPSLTHTHTLAHDSLLYVALSMPLSLLLMQSVVLTQSSWSQIHQAKKGNAMLLKQH